MVYIVEVPVAEERLSERMNQMRAWLDHQRSAPSRFQVSDAGAESPGFRVYFNAEDEAAAFARQFGGSVRSIPAADALL